MPIEIREPTIKVSVNPTQDGSSGNMQENDAGKQQQEGSGQEDIIATCIEQVMERIKDKLER